MSRRVDWLTLFARQKKVEIIEVHGQIVVRGRERLKLETIEVRTSNWRFTVRMLKFVRARLSVRPYVPKNIVSSI